MKWLFLTTLVILAWTSNVANSWLLPGGQRLSEQEEDLTNKGELWAILVAGSNGWWNYRHQADVCHAYQILRKHGVPDDHIIVMMYDDIAYNRENPNPGVIINRPGGPNVYSNILKDYTGDDVTPENFLNILKGNTSAMAGKGSGKVVKSSPNDRVFINMVDHGAPGIFAFPDSYLHARTLANTINKLHDQKKFGEIVLYVEACESGSMFNDLLPQNDKTYAVTASSPDEPSFACYMDEELHTYLGDVFSVKWMEDTDRENIKRETLRKQFDLVKREVTTSTVMEWGEEDISKQKLSDFMGKKGSPFEEEEELSINSIRYVDDENNSNVESAGVHHDGDGVDKMTIKNDECTNSAVAVPDVPIAIMESRVEKAQNNEEKEHWKMELTTLHLRRLLVHIVMRSLVKEVTENEELAAKMIKKSHQNITNWDCYERSVDTFHDKCFNLGENPFALRVLYMLVNLCEHGYTAEKFEKAAGYICTHPKFTGIL